MKYLLFSSILLVCLSSCGAQSSSGFLKNADGSFTLLNNPDSVNAVYLSKDGNMGIGKQNPTDKLEVNGQIHARAVKVDLDDWADFVFEREYELARLSEIENYIHQNGHLPGIPSAEKVLKEGIELGEMNRLLLLKIEELTLHLITQEKKIEHLAETVEVLSSELKDLKTKD